MNVEATKFRNSVFFIVSFTILLWLVKALEWAVALDFGFLGILPRTLSGTMGIITAPLVHGDVLHLISNTFPLLLLGVSVFYFYNRIALEVFAWIYFMSGFWVWMAARDAYHIGASGIVYGLVAFLFFSGLFRRDTKSLTISLIVIFLYGGMLQGLFPTNDRISWESHLLGALAGAFCAFFYREVKLQDYVQHENDHHATAEAGTVESAMVPVRDNNTPANYPAPDMQRPLASNSYAAYQQAIDSYPLLQAQTGSRPPLPSGREQTAVNAPQYKLNRQYIYVSKPSAAGRNKQPRHTFYIIQLPHSANHWQRSSTTR